MYMYACTCTCNLNLLVVHVSDKCLLIVNVIQNFGQPLNRVLMGNFEYRMFLRCRHAAKLRFIKLRSDVLVKLQLLDNKRGMVRERERERFGGLRRWWIYSLLSTAVVGLLDQMAG